MAGIYFWTTANTHSDQLMSLHETTAVLHRTYIFGVNNKVANSLTNWYYIWQSSLSKIYLNLLTLKSSAFASRQMGTQF